MSSARLIDRIWAFHIQPSFRFENVDRDGDFFRFVFVSKNSVTLKTFTISILQRTGQKSAVKKCVLGSNLSEQPSQFCIYTTWFLEAIFFVIYGKPWKGCIINFKHLLSSFVHETNFTRLHALDLIFSSIWKWNCRIFWPFWQGTKSMTEVM